MKKLLIATMMVASFSAQAHSHVHTECHGGSFESCLALHEETVKHGIEDYPIAQALLGMTRDEAVDFLTKNGYSYNPDELHWTNAEGKGIGFWNHNEDGTVDSAVYYKTNGEHIIYE